MSIAAQGTTLRQNQQGLTIVELSIALTVTAILMTVVVAFSVDRLRQSDLQSIKYQQLTTAQTGVDQILTDVRVASNAADNNAVQDPNAPGAPANQLSWTSDSTHLVLSTAATDANHNVLWQDSLDYVSYKNNIVYFLSGTTLYRRVLANTSASGNAAVTTCPAANATATCPADHIVLNNVQTFNVQYLNSVNDTVGPSSARSIKVTVQLQNNRYGQVISTGYSAQMVFRNG